jgi:hypothetical protein
MFHVLLHPSSGAQLQLSAIGVCNGLGMLIHWSRYWLGLSNTFKAVAAVTALKVYGSLSQYLLQWINIPKPLPQAVFEGGKWGDHPRPRS